MPYPARSLTLIVATTFDLGIGQNGSLPWPSLKSEMAYFARVTQRPPASLPQGTKNAVIMGRKTWESIPERFRPLKGRLNYVVSRTLKESGQELAGSGAAQSKNSEVILSGSLEEALESLNLREQHNRAGGSSVSTSSGTQQPNEVGHVFVIGGGTIYASALKLQRTHRILLTKIKRPAFKCDTFFSLDLDSDDAKQQGWQKKGSKELEAFVGENFGELGTTRVEGDVEYEFCLYEKSDGA